MISSEGICDIIKACGECRVIQFNFNGLKIFFKGYTEICETPKNIPILDENEFISHDEINTKDDEIANMKITNPFLYETLLAQKELED